MTSRRPLVPRVQGALVPILACLISLAKLAQPSVLIEGVGHRDRAFNLGLATPPPVRTGGHRCLSYPRSDDGCGQQGLNVGQVRENLIADASRVW